MPSLSSPSSSPPTLDSESAPPLFLLLKLHRLTDELALDREYGDVCVAAKVRMIYGAKAALAKLTAAKKLWAISFIDIIADA